MFDPHIYVSPPTIPREEWAKRIAEHEEAAAKRQTAILQYPAVVFRYPEGDAIQEKATDIVRQIKESQYDPIRLPSVINYCPPASYGRPVYVCAHCVHYKGWLHSFFQGKDEVVALVESELGNCSLVNASWIQFLDREKPNDAPIRRSGEDGTGARGERGAQRDASDGKGDSL